MNDTEKAELRRIALHLVLSETSVFHISDKQTAKLIVDSAKVFYDYLFDDKEQT